MNLRFNIADPLCVPNIKSAALAASMAYDQATYTDSQSGEQVLIQDCDNCFAISFPGTHNIRDVLRDAEFLRVETSILGQKVSVHEGFDKKFRALKDRVVDSAKQMRKPIFLFGHSAGAAVARRHALNLCCIPGVTVYGLIVFGEPRGGDSRYVKLCNNFLGARTISIANAADPVPWMPGWLIGNRPLLPNAYLPPGAQQIVTGASLLYELAHNLPELFRAWRLKELTPLSDHYINSYIGRVNALA